MEHKEYCPKSKVFPQHLNDVPCTCAEPKEPECLVESCPGRNNCEEMGHCELPKEDWEGKNYLLDTENLSSRLHQVYEKEVARQGKQSKHPKFYHELSEDVKNLDRALAKYIIEFIIPQTLANKKEEVVKAV